MTEGKAKRRRRWRDYRTAAGGRPVRDFLDALTDEELAEVVAAMKDVSAEGLAAAKHLRGELYEVKAEAPTRSFRVLFATEGRFGQVLLSLSAFVKKTQKAPKQELELAEKRLNDWRSRGKAKK
jgi:phage-related protein